VEDNFGDRMKMLEGTEAARRFIPLLPVCARLDGKAFHTWTADLERPYDARLSQIMEEVTAFLVKETCALVGYTQSDEISLVFYSDNYDAKIFFDGRIHKMTSVLAAMTAAKFNELAASLPRPEGKPRRLAFFDCRVWQAPTLEEAANVLVWREMDATRNSVSCAAQSVYERKNLMGVKTSDLHEMLHDKGINWNDYPDFFKRGSYYARRRAEKEMTPEELARIPGKFRPAPGHKVERTEVVRLPMPPITKVATRVGVLFKGEDPVLRSDEGPPQKVVINVDEWNREYTRLMIINRVNLEDVEFVDDSGKRLEVTEKALDDFRFTGLSNKEFILYDMWRGFELLHDDPDADVANFGVLERNGGVSRVTTRTSPDDPPPRKPA
jgi:tRNA(His) 5'-end guanylyltransferase